MSVHRIPNWEKVRTLRYLQFRTATGVNVYARMCTCRANNTVPRSLSYVRALQNNLKHKVFIAVDFSSRTFVCFVRLLNVFQRRSATSITPCAVMASTNKTKHNKPKSAVVARACVTLSSLQLHQCHQRGDRRQPPDVQWRGQGRDGRGQDGHYRQPNHS